MGLRFEEILNFKDEGGVTEIIELFEYNYCFEFELIPGDILGLTDKIKNVTFNSFDTSVETMAVYHAIDVDFEIQREFELDWDLFKETQAIV